MYFVCTLRSHYSCYLQIFLASNTIARTKCNAIRTVLSIQSNPTHGWTQRMTISELTMSHQIYLILLSIGNLFDVSIIVNCSLTII